MRQNVREAMLYEALPESRARCNVCQWRCVIGPGKFGVCRVRQNREGKLYLLNYALVSSAAVDPIEKKPLFHFYPGSEVFSLGGWGCNFHCEGCQNWEIACTDVPPDASQMISPEAAIEITRQRGSAGIAWTYNEPGIWLEYTLDSAKLAKRHRLYTVYVTNGYSTPEALDMIGPYLDAWRVDIKGFSDALYRKLAKVSKWQGILDVAKRARDKWGMHVEVVTNIIPTLNDDDEQLRGIAGWIRSELGELTPWHVTRFYPHRHMNQIPPTPVATLERAIALGREAGLRFIYAGNIPGHSSENTTCYSCGKLVVRRRGYQTQVVGLKGSNCSFCGAELNFRT
ncbi:MAG: AmmeMemoRadiSam system radical SAM enzyme [Dehalococcoidia bacterium]|nr:AmmeMemoRadiSam system radical SAM enzyme [Dehalococcoidia bacterium]